MEFYLRLLVTLALLVATLTIFASLGSPSSRPPPLRSPKPATPSNPPFKPSTALKNRGAAPTTRDINPSVSLAAMVRPGPDETRWDDQKAATVVGYVADVKMGGIETVNCHARSPHGRDTHIDLTVTPSDAHDDAGM